MVCNLFSSRAFLLGTHMMEGWRHVFRWQLQAQSIVVPLATQDPPESPFLTSSPHTLLLTPAGTRNSVLLFCRETMGECPSGVVTTLML